jgi:selenocysteine-specific elongation factor
LEELTVKTLERFHEANPLVAGLCKEELRARIGAAVAMGAKPARGSSAAANTHRAPPSVAAFNAVLQALGARRTVDARGETVMGAGRTPRLSPEEAEARDQISRAFEMAGLAVPGAAEVLATLRIDRRRAEQILQMLLKEKVLVKVVEGLIFHRSALEGLQAALKERKAQSDRINVAVFKEMTGLSRKYVIPLLEYLDRERVTRRQGDERIIL